MHLLLHPALQVQLPAMQAAVIVTACIGLTVCVGLVISGLRDKQKEENHEPTER